MVVDQCIRILQKKNVDVMDSGRLMLHCPSCVIKHARQTGERPRVEKEQERLIVDLQ